MRHAIVALALSGCFDYSNLSESPRPDPAADLEPLGAAPDGGDPDGAAAPDDADVVDGGTGDTAPTSDALPPAADMVSFPHSCLDVRLGDAAAVDGPYTLYVSKNAAKPWSAYCRDVQGTPKDYLILPMAGANTNFSQYTAGGSSPGTSVRTNYQRVRVDPDTFMVDVSDQTFSTSAGLLTHPGPSIVTSMPYAVAMDCTNASGTGPATGLGNVDLRGTPFTVAAASFFKGGFVPSGAFSYSSANQVVSITGGGNCGWTSGGQHTATPCNVAGGWQLQLVHP